MNTEPRIHISGRMSINLDANCNLIRFDYGCRRDRSDIQLLGPNGKICEGGEGGEGWRRANRRGRRLMQKSAINFTRRRDSSRFQFLAVVLGPALTFTSAVVLFCIILNGRGKNEPTGAISWEFQHSPLSCGSYGLKCNLASVTRKCYSRMCKMT